MRKAVIAVTVLLLAAGCSLPGKAKDAAGDAATALTDKAKDEASATAAAAADDVKLQAFCAVWVAARGSARAVAAAGDNLVAAAPVSLRPTVQDMVDVARQSLQSGTDSASSTFAHRQVVADTLAKQDQLNAKCAHTFIHT